MTTQLTPPSTAQGPTPPPDPAGPTSTTRPRRQPAAAKPMVSLLGAVSVLAGSAALLTTISGLSWVGPAVQIVGLVWLIGLGCRLLRFPAPATVLTQAAGVLITLTAVFTTGGYGGLIPNARAAQQAEALLSGAWEQIMRSTVPAPSTPQLGFLIAVTLGLLALVVDFFVSEVDAPALVALPLLCLYSVPASIAESMLPWWSFALPAAAYALLVAVAGHPGRHVGLRAGVGVAVAGGLALVLAVAGSLVVADSITDVGTAGRIDRDNEPLAGSDVGLSPFASLHGDLTRGDARKVLEVSGLPEPDYLRAYALEAWDANQGFSLIDPENGAERAGSPVLMEPLARNPGSIEATVNVRVLDYADKFVPIYQGTKRIDGLASDYLYNQELGSVFRTRSTRPSDYQMTVDAGPVSPDLLRADTLTPTPLLVSRDGIPDDAVTLAQEVTAAGQTAFDKALLLKDFFTDPVNRFVYSLEVPVGNSGSLLTDFLENRQGYCEQYAAAMAIMLRSLDIPARVAVGFTKGTALDGVVTITSHDAHAWVEVRFDNAGWVRFDPTPLSPSIGGEQGFATSAPESSSAPATTGATLSNPDDAPTAGDNTGRATQTQFETLTVAGSNGGGDGTPFWRPWFTVVLVMVAVLALLGTLPWLWRRRRARSRLTVAGAGGSDAPAAAWAEVEDLALDHGFPSGRGVTVRRAANLLAKEGKLGERARSGLRRIALGTESSWYSPQGYVAGDGTDLAEDVRQIAVDLEHAAPRTLRTRLFPPSLISRD